MEEYFHHDKRITSRPATGRGEFGNTVFQMEYGNRGNKRHAINRNSQSVTCMNSEFGVTCDRSSRVNIGRLH
jgi:hypothetical protein